MGNSVAKQVLEQRPESFGVSCHRSQFGVDIERRRFRVDSLPRLSGSFSEVDRFGLADRAAAFGQR